MCTRCQAHALGKTSLAGKTAGTFHKAGRERRCSRRKCTAPRRVERASPREQVLRDGGRACERGLACAIQWRDEQPPATYQGKKVPLNKPMSGDVKKSKVYVDPDGDGKAKKVNFGDKNMTIKKNIPARRKSFRARHNCENPGPKDKARYWSCKAW